MTTPGLRILLADDHPVVLAGIKSLVTAEEGLDVIGEAQDGLSALEMSEALQPDIAVIDISMPGLIGTALAGRMRTSCPGCRLIALTVHEDRGYLRQMLEGGVAGYVLKRSAAEDLVKAVRIVAAGGIYIDPEMSTKAFDNSPASSAEHVSNDGADLSKREIEVLRLLSEGYSSKAAAARLDIAVKTIETYKARAFEKLGFQSRVELIRYAVSRGWFSNGM
ncbi:response regulator [Aestuariivirga sp.]|uniref:response regulator n=1 Tax=Aestuariivirga sp. TaxID=2650926 RepID=UPI003593DF94